MLLRDQKGPEREGGEITIRRHALRRQVMAAARHRFARHGAANVALQDIAAGAGMEWGEFLTYFQDKDRLLTAVLDEGWKDLLPRITDIASSAPSAHSAMVTVFAFLTNVLQKDEDLARLVLFEGRRADRETGEIGLTGGYRRFLQICRELVVRGQRDGSFGYNYHPQVAASMLVGALEGMLRDRIIVEQEQSITAYSGSYLISTYDALVSSLKN